MQNAKNTHADTHMTPRAPSVGGGICKDTVRKGGGSRGGDRKGSISQGGGGRDGLPPRDAQITLINGGGSRS